MTSSRRCRPRSDNASGSQHAAASHGTEQIIKCLLTRTNEDPVLRDTRAQSTTQKKKQSRRYGVSSSHEEYHSEIRNTLVTLEATLD